MNAIRTQRSPHDPNASSQRGRSGRRIRGRAKHVGFSNRTDHAPNSLDEKNNQDVLVTGSENEHNSSSVQVNADRSNAPMGRNRSYKSSGPGGRGGKYRQRNQTNQLLEGMSDLTGLGIDLAESIVPTGSNSKSVEASKGRHSTNNRKVNLTHLLNYKFEGKNRGNKYNQQSSSYSERDTHLQRRNIGSHYRDPGTLHKFNKQQFLQANCQFVVLNGHDYIVHKVDPDWPVDWDCIEEVRFKQSASTETTCPICLEPPTAAKITRCGHIYCWTCMLHYLSLSDENCRQCPICFEPVYQNHLRSVVSCSFPNFSVNDEINMKLMVRKKGCVEVEPYKVVEVCDNSSTETCRERHSSAGNDQYWSQDNLVIVDATTVIANIAQREREELLIKMALDKDEPEVCFIEQAISFLEKRVEKLHQSITLGPKNSSHHNSVRQESLDANIESSKSYLFYQGSDGQHIYLNPFSTKILCHEFGSLEHCPPEISAKILQMDWISMSEAWRKRFRYLEHLPLTCEFRLVEIDFEKSNLISPDTYGFYEGQIRKRKQERERRQREERKREKIIQVEQDRKIYGIQPSLKINLNNIDQFPSVSDERYLGLSQPRGHTSETVYLSSDDDEFSNDGHAPANSSSAADYDQTNTVDEVSENNPSVVDVTSEIALSFNDIQLQEAAKAAIQSSKGASKSLPLPTNAWSTKQKQSSSTNAQSSFAQLLVNAKTSPKQWTRNVSSNNAASSNRSRNPTISSDDGGEELRAPPCEFTISDFIDLNVVSNAGKKRSNKTKSSNKKGC